jgi:hypothetical protein
MNGSPKGRVEKPEEGVHQLAGAVLLKPLFQQSLKMNTPNFPSQIVFHRVTLIAFDKTCFYDIFDFA